MCNLNPLGKWPYSINENYFPKRFCVWGCGSSLECLPCMCEALNHVPTILWQGQGLYHLWLRTGDLECMPGTKPSLWRSTTEVGCFTLSRYPVTFQGVFRGIWPNVSLQNSGILHGMKVSFCRQFPLFHSVGDLSSCEYNYYGNIKCAFKMEI